MMTLNHQIHIFVLKIFILQYHNECSYMQGPIIRESNRSNTTFPDDGSGGMQRVETFNVILLYKYV